jgi:phenylacetate-coenzyme A ligase PaaK-like adenylate-forming protein
MFAAGGTNMNPLRRRLAPQTVEEMRARAFSRLLRFVRREVAPHSPYYRRRFAEWGIDPRALRTPEDWAKLPFTDKRDLVGDPGAPPRAPEFVLQPDPAALARRPSTVLRALLRGREAARAALEREYRPIFLTSTTGRSAEPVPFLYTGHDLDRLSAAGRDLCEVMQCQTDWRLLNLFPYAPHLGFWQVHTAMLAFNVFGLSTGGGKTLGTEGNLKLMARIQPDGVIAMPTFLYHLLSLAREQRVRLPKLRRLVLGGEKVPDGMRTRLGELARELGGEDVRVLAVYGFTEIRMAWGECPGEAGTATGYHVPPEYAWLEIVDPATGAVQPPGVGGELVVTPIEARGSVVLRYRTGDLVEGGLVYGPCPHCGLNLPRLVGRINRRSEVRELRVDKIKGTLVDFNALEHLLDDLPGLASWQVELRKANDDPHQLDELIVHAVGEGPPEPLADRIRSVFREKLEITPNAVRFHSREEMAALQGVGRELKERRLVDARPRAP